VSLERLKLPDEDPAAVSPTTTAIKARRRVLYGRGTTKAILGVGPFSRNPGPGRLYIEPLQGMTDGTAVKDATPTLSVSINSNNITYTTINPPGSRYTIASSINDLGQIVGFYQDSNGQEHGFLDSGGTYITIDPLGSIETIADSINASGQIVGWYFGSSGTHQQGFLDSGGTSEMCQERHRPTSRPWLINKPSRARHSGARCRCRRRSSGR
jgi:probable HAF family extracellular repeat protein